MTELSRTDVNILDILQQEARLPNVELADRIGMSPSPCLRRVKQLEANGLIERYVALLDRRNVGLGILAFAEVKVPRRDDDAHVERFKAAVQREPMVIGCYILAGQFDFLLKVVAADLDAYADFLVHRLLKMPGVQDVRSSFVMETVKDTTALPLDHLKAG
jgi:Lrp/AsnC family leucine-responsive transcriptional regulator